MTADHFIPFFVPSIEENAIREVVETLRSGWITTGQRCFQFEREFQDYVGAQTALAVSSCTAGLHLALTALGIGPGDEVITTPLTFCATANVIVQTGAKPVLADIGDDFNIDPDAIRSRITRNTRAIVPVHVAGLPCDLQAIWGLAREYGLKVVEDAAHAVGAQYQGMQIGAGMSDAVAFSFYANKNLTTGEGGMITSPVPELTERMRILSLHGINKDAWRRYSREGTWYYEVTDCGFKYNLPDILAAIGIHQLRKLDEMTARRIDIARAYKCAFSEMPEIELPPDRSDSRHCWHLYMLRLQLNSLDVDRDTFFSEMRAQGVGCSVHFIPIQLHPYYRKLMDSDPCPRSLAEYRRLISIPLYPAMTDADVNHVIAAVKNVVTKCKKRKLFFVPQVVGQTLS
ncbi:MAG: DegT/DnrJ/EryC1/StrS aminotransferase family protein [Bryobacteraceae bacterium]